MTAQTRITLSCDLCGSFMDLWCSSATAARLRARVQGWRRDRLGRDLCANHPKLKGSR